MQLQNPNITWHGQKERIMSIAFNPFDPTELLTAGSDIIENGYIKQWQICYNLNKNEQNMNPNIEGQQKVHKPSKFVKYVKDLRGHINTVNCIRYSNDGHYFASGVDDKTVIIWEIKMKPIKFGELAEELTWATASIMRGHSSDVYDICWSNDSQYLVSGSIDNRCIIWKVDKGTIIQTLIAHTHFVQGVSVDPFFRIIVSLSSDRTVRVWKKHIMKKGRKNQVQFYQSNTLKRQEIKPRLTKMEVEQQKQDQLNILYQTENTEKPTFNLFLSENALTTFYRRADWAPDGTICLVPCGNFHSLNPIQQLFQAQYKHDKNKPPVLCVLAYKRNYYKKPCFKIPTKKAAVVVKFCPKIFKRDQNNPFSLIDVPYKMVFAIATVDSILVYSTQSQTPLYIVGNVHYAILTDLTWANQQTLGVASSDGFCSFLVFEENELGNELTQEDKFVNHKSYYREREFQIALQREQNEKENNNLNSNTKMEIEEQFDQNKESGKQSKYGIIIQPTKPGEKKRIIPTMICSTK